jgi:uncharacterized protein YigA (DUF484 family)
MYTTTEEAHDLHDTVAALSDAVNRQFGVLSSALRTLQRQQQQQQAGDGSASAELEEEPESSLGRASPADTRSDLAAR